MLRAIGNTQTQRAFPRCKGGLATIFREKRKRCRIARRIPGSGMTKTKARVEMRIVGKMTGMTVVEEEEEEGTMKGPVELEEV